MKDDAGPFVEEESVAAEVVVSNQRNNISEMETFSQVAVNINKSLKPSCI